MPQTPLSIATKKKTRNNQGGGKRQWKLPQSSFSTSCHSIVPPPGFFTFFSTNIRPSIEILWQNNNTGSFFFQRNKASVRREHTLPACGSCCGNAASLCTSRVKRAARTRSFITWGNFSSLRPTKGARSCLGELLHKSRVKVISYRTMLRYFLQEQWRTPPKLLLRAFCRLPAVLAALRVNISAAQPPRAALLWQDTHLVLPGIALKGLFSSPRTTTEPTPEPPPPSKRTMQRNYKIQSLQETLRVTFQRHLQATRAVLHTHV